MTDASATYYQDGEYLYVTRDGWVAKYRISDLPAWPVESLKAAS